MQALVGIRGWHLKARDFKTDKSRDKRCPDSGDGVETDTRSGIAC